MGPDFFAYGGDAEEAMVQAMGDPTDADRAWVREEVARAAARAPARPDAADRHQQAAYRGEWGELEALAAVDAPALVVHGDADRRLPMAHGRAIARALPDARLLVLPGMGHLPRPSEWEQIAAEVVAHLG
jgi:3-oxoadipate enol-lactonase